MRINTVATLAALTLVTAACSPPALDVTKVGQASTLGLAGRKASTVARESNALSVPNDYRTIVLPAPTTDMPMFGIVSWDAYLYHERHKGLNGLQGANMADLMAFQARYQRGAAADYLGLCAPVEVKAGGSLWKASLSRGRNFGLNQACEWALVVLPVPAVPHQ